MLQPLIINLAIICVIVVGIVVTHNPLFILGLLLLQNMPFVMPQPAEEYAEDPDAEEEGQPMGFTADVK